jgi:hypothetical protein
LTGAAITDPALAEPFIAAGAAVAFWFFFATEKELSPRGYERNEIIKCLVTPSTRKISYFECIFLKKIFLKRCARVILNKVKELSCYESKILLTTTKVPQLLKGRFRDDVCFKF